jgi:DNA mismatch repair protein MutS2
MAFSPGDEVHVAGLGKGVVREVRNGGRYLVELKARSIVADEAQLSRVTTGKRTSPSSPSAPQPRPPRGNVPTSLDLHGKTVEEALAAVDEFLNDALLSGHAEIRLIHGRSGGRVKSGVHKRLKELPVVRAFRLDPGNAGVTIVTL